MKPIKISQTIKDLQRILDEEGDCDLFVEGYVRNGTINGHPAYRMDNIPVESVNYHSCTGEVIIFAEP
jgi:hypothetical protein